MATERGPLAVELCGLEKRYDQFLAVDRLDLTVEPGELFGFLGPNGAGKTTTLMMLAGLLRPTAGTVRIFGGDVHANPEPAKQVLAYIPDRPFLYEKLTGRELLGFVDELYRGDQATRGSRVNDLLQRFGLLGFGDNLVESYSHGMRQRLVFGCALIHEPRLMVVDEPMVGLDPLGTRLVKDAFKDICARGGTVLMSTHTMQVAEELCDRIAIIDHGRIVTMGTMVELRTTAAAGNGTLEDVFLALTNSTGDAPLAEALLAEAAS